MIGRNMDKANKETKYILVGLLLLLAWIVFMITLLPKNPVPRDWYMTSQDILMADILALLFIAVLILIGLAIGRWIEARLYQRNGRYLGKGEID